MARERYPDWVKKFRPKGCIVKRKGTVYQVYTATSKRVPGKKYPVVEVGEMVGTIDPSGFHGKTRMVIDFMSSTTLEYGFTDLALTKEEEFLALKKRQGMDEKDARAAYRSAIVSISPCSYLSVTEKVMTMDDAARKLSISVCRLKSWILNAFPMPEECMRLLFTAVGIWDGKTFRRIPLSPQLKEMLPCYGIGEEDMIHGR